MVLLLCGMTHNYSSIVAYIMMEYQMHSASFLFQSWMKIFQHALLWTVLDEDIPTRITVDSDKVLFALRGFPQSSSCGGSCLHVQHFLDTISGTTVPATY